MTIESACQALTPLLGERVSRSKPVLDAHAGSETHFPHTPPDAVAFPETTAEVAQIVSICAEHRCPVVGWGTGTALEGHALAFKGGVTVDFSRMDQVIEVQPENMIARVQPGLTREALNLALRDTGLFFPVDPGANASLGGMAATRASGTTTVRYGTMRDNVAGVEAVLADGRVIRTGGAARKSSAGYDLTALMVGSEGTLGLMTELTLRLHGQPEAISAAICAFDTMEDAVGAVTDTIQLGLPMARIEFLDAATVRAFNAYAGEDMPECPHLMLEFHGSEMQVSDQAETFGALAADHNGQNFRWSSRAEDRRALWAMRHNGYYAILQSKPGHRALVTDVCVPIARLAEAVNAAQDDIAASPLDGPILGHVGDGNFHAILMVQNAADLDEAHRLSDLMVRRALEMGGTATGEHGVGVGKLDYMAAEHGTGWDVMGEIKRALDPHNILNPGKLVRLNG